MRLSGKRLTGQQIKQFREALLDAFGLERFDELLKIYLDREREHIALGNNLETIVFRVIQRAEDQSWTAELLQAARAADPHNLALLAFAQQFGLAPATAQGLELERTIKKSNSALDVVKWRTRLAEIETQVCRIEIKAGGEITLGTGFLLGPDVMMTNYHVMENVITGRVSPRRVVLCFDYKKMADGSTVNPGTKYGLAEQDWLLDYSEYSMLDLLTDTDGTDPQPDQLDYALLRVAGAPGRDPVGGESNQDVQAPARGWIQCPVEEYDFVPRTALFIMQHPDGEPLKLALDTEAIIPSGQDPTRGTNRNKTRVRYATNTERGSSGSPCFNANWELVAVHHGGDPNYEAFHHPTYNQGIPFHTIVSLLTNRGKEVLLTMQEKE